MVDGSFGEVLTTCEKITWTLANGENALKPESRGVGMLTIHKTAQVRLLLLFCIPDLARSPSLLSLRSRFQFLSLFLSYVGAHANGASSLQVEYQPMGVLGAIIPWNYPFHNMLGQVWFDPTHSFLQL